ncbi:sulfurtransferase TusA family protein [Nitrosomonas ureae]|uniref:tRNA 2-thiouridine synthesizing protein A n=1 Tax=Nitrosomonas ureae TaxID=44577 RepID=A0A0S3AI32_9PROT|nr:sulfurtransferase TusA family protein [Nitrosomonas ureae]ALQ50839.1 preprotein translocase subunit TatC [Nitrosomonas ureae]PTQ87756.1 tRNA 2-thiouridine synthesizing protein A [Nitrosomonas ureae]PXX16566.1 tRNA 2-thiouridine synthesizing protein A [Nitrosomonas ureae]SDT85718.1 tRNA 2-thiouridine synthesizing protein A [Nitrosomonas ureae]SEP94735.1 tRNA 2-thiouridine synthesizing protein A [Nitrosomonas ureae]
MDKIDKELDASGLVCPLPILRTKQSLADMISGQTLRIVATDPGSLIDFQVFSEQTGNELLSMTQNTGEFIFILRKR